MHKTPIKQKPEKDRTCLVCGNFAKVVRCVESKRTETKGKIDLKTLLNKYGGVVVESGILCRNCYVKLLNLDQRCRQFYEECQRNAAKMLTKTKRMRASPLSGPNKRMNISKTPIKSRYKLFNDSVIESTTEDGDTTTESNKDTWTLSEETTPSDERHYRQHVWQLMDCGSEMEISSDQSPVTEAIHFDHEYCFSEGPKRAETRKETKPEEPTNTSVHTYISSESKTSKLEECVVMSEHVEHSYAGEKCIRPKMKKKQLKTPVTTAIKDNQPPDHDYITSRPAPLRFNPILEKIGSSRKNLEHSSCERLSEQEKSALCAVINTSENVSQVTAKILEIETLDKCIQYHRTLQINKASYTLRHRKHVSVSVLMKKAPEDLKQFNWVDVVEELMEKFPVFFEMALYMMLSPNQMHCYTVLEKMLPRLGLVYGILTQSRNKELSRIQRMVSLLLFDNICDQKIYDRLQPMGVCLSYSRSLQVVEIIGGHFNDQLIQLLQKGKRFRLVGDNINWKVGVHDQRLDHTSKMMHAFGSAAIVQNVDFMHLSTKAPQRMYDETPVQVFLPSATDIEETKRDYAVLVSRVMFEYIPYFRSFEDIVPSSISKPCDTKLKQKSTVIPLPVLFRNEQYTQDVVKILEYYEECLAEAHQKAGLEIESKKIHIGGDQLTRIRFSEAKSVRAHHPLHKDKFEHLSPITFELFHLYMNFLKMIFKTLYRSDSVQDVGTMKSLQDRISRTNVNQNINEHYDADKDFVISVTDMYLIECILEFFGMEDVNTQPTKHVAPEFNTCDEKKDWYFKVIGKMIHDQIFSSSSPALGKETIKVDGQTFDLTLGNGKVVTLMKPYVRPAEEQDRVHNYARRILEAGLLFKDMLDMTHMPERRRGLRLLKLCMVYLKSHNNLSKYAYEILRFLVHQFCILSEMEAHEEFYGLFVNTAGKYDSHIPVDRRMEYLVKQVKMHIKHMVSNKTEENISNRTRAISGIREISENIDRQCSVIVRSKRHSDRSSQGDELVILDDLRRIRPFQHIPGRTHAAFPNMTASVVDALPVTHFHNWVDTRKFYFAVEKGN